jgi:hypothetical protein
VDSETKRFPCHAQTITSYHLVKEGKLQVHIPDNTQGVPLHS